MAVIPNIVNMVAGINERKRGGRTREALSNYLTNPEEAEVQLMDAKTDPVLGMKLREQRKAAETAATEKSYETFQKTIGLLRGVPAERQGQVLDGLAPALSPILGEDGMTKLRGAFAADPSLANRLDTEAWKGLSEQMFSPYTLTAGSKRGVNGEEIDYQPFQTDTVRVKRGDGGEEIVLFDPNPGGGFITDESQIPGSGARQAGGVALAGVEPPMADTPEGLGADFDTAFGTAPRQAPAAVIARGENRDSRLVAGQATGAQIEAIAMSAIPGMTEANVTSRKRSAAKNKAVGGSANSYHLTDQARDFVPPKGMSMGQLAAQLRSAYGPGFDVINEGDHVHVEPGSRAGGGRAPAAPAAAGLQSQPQPGVQVSRTRVSAGGPQQEAFRPATPAELQGYPQGTAAQVDTRTGKLVNIKTPPAGRAAAGSAAAGTPKQQADAAAREVGRSQLGTVLTSLADSYVNLRNIPGAISQTGAGAGRNIEAFFNTTSLGQTLQRATGAEAQAVRDDINNMRPLLINQIRAATGMSAKSMDSNAELQFFLQAATDPSRELVTNLAAIHALDELYGTGGSLRQTLPPDVFKMVQDRSVLLRQSNGGSQSRAPAAPAVGTVRNGYRFKGGNPAEQASWEKVR